MDPTAQTALSLSDKAMTLVGKIFGPSFTRRQADADARAEIQAVLTEQVAAYMESHPNDPMMLEALLECGGKTNLRNLALIAQKAIPQLTDDARPDQISDDWAANAKDKARTCSDPDMAELWAQLIAGEANAPGSYSRKTVNVLADMDPEDAHLFRNVARFRLVPCKYTYHRQTGTIVSIEPNTWNSKLAILDPGHQTYSVAGANFITLSRMTGLGLIYQPGLGYQVRHDHTAAYSYGSGFLYVSSENSINFGSHSFTHAGEQLANLCVPFEPPDGFIDYLAEEWRRGGATVTLDPSGAVLR